MTPQSYIDIRLAMLAIRAHQECIRSWRPDPKPRPEKLRKDDFWDQLDWSKTDKQLAAELGICHTWICVKRNRMGKPHAPRPYGVCGVAGCLAKHFSKGFCNKHFHQMRRGTLDSSMLREVG